MPFLAFLMAPTTASVDHKILLFCFVSSCTKKTFLLLLLSGDVFSRSSKQNKMGKENIEKCKAPYVIKVLPCKNCESIFRLTTTTTTKTPYQRNKYFDIICGILHIYMEEKKLSGVKSGGFCYCSLCEWLD